MVLEAGLRLLLSGEDLTPPNDPGIDIISSKGDEFEIASAGEGGDPEIFRAESTADRGVSAVDSPYGTNPGGEFESASAEGVGRGGCRC